VFVGREKELASLNERYASHKYECAIIYGRRRVGKTELIKEFVKGKKHIFFSAVEGTERRNLDILSNSIYSGLSGSTMVSAPRFGDFASCLEHICGHMQDEKIVFVIDEYPYLAKSEQSTSSILQQYIDHRFQHLDCMLILCGSSMSFMEEQVMGYQSPLYGRRTCQYRLLPFDFATSSMFHQGFSKEEKAVVHGVTGGIPKYLRQFDDGKSLKQNIIENFFSAESLLFEEPLNLLKQELREPQTYNDIITAIATGSSEMNKIVSKIGISGFDSAKCNKYLRSLISLGIVKKETPVFSKPNAKRTIYRLNDGMFRFWYRFVYNNTPAISLGAGADVYERISEQIPAFMGEVFEGIAIEYLWRENMAGRLPFVFQDCGRWWGNNPLLKKEQEIDILAYSSDGGKAIFAECKWTNEKVDNRVLKGLMEKAAMFARADSYYMLFSKSGFKSDIINTAQQNDRIMLVCFAEMEEKYARF
jgi:AAA+ ATPase superfamily predicted ATPase